MSEHPPERRRVPGQFITMDAAMLAQQNERLASLDESIQALAKSVNQRPTKFDLESTRKRLRNQLIATVLVGAILFTFVFIQNQKLQQACLDRNANTEKFRTLIAVITNETSKADPDGPVATSLTEYLLSLIHI